MHKYRVMVFKNGFATTADIKSNKNYNNYLKWIVKRSFLADRMRPRIVLIKNRIVYDPDMIEINEIEKAEEQPDG